MEPTIEELQAAVVAAKAAMDAQAAFIAAHRTQSMPGSLNHAKYVRLYWAHQEALIALQSAEQGE